MITIVLLLAACEAPPESGTKGSDTDTGAPVDSADSQVWETDSGPDFDSGTDSDSGEVDSDTDSGGIPTTELPGNGIDEDLDGSVDEFRGADLTEGLYNVQDVTEDSGGMFVAITYPGWGSLHVLDRGAFLSGTWLGGSFNVGGGDGRGFSARWIPDVNGDGVTDLLGIVDHALDYPEHEYLNAVFSGADVTTRDVAADEAIAAIGGWGHERTDVTTFESVDGEPALAYRIRSADETSTTQWLLPCSCLADGDCQTSEAFASVVDVYFNNREDGPFDRFDFDGDGFADVQAHDSNGVVSAYVLLYSGTQLDTIGLEASDAAWSLDVASDVADMDVFSTSLTDFNGDGYADVVGSAGNRSLTPACTAFAVFGPLAGTTLWADVTTRWPMGDDVRCEDNTVLDDIDGDGIPDLAAAGQPDYPVYSVPGRVDIIPGALLAGGGVLDPAVDRWAVIEGLDPGDELGYYLYPYDFDGDGTQDLAVYSESAYLSDDGLRYSGTGVWFDIANPG